MRNEDTCPGQLGAAGDHRDCRWCTNAAAATAGRYIDFNGDGKTDILFLTSNAPTADLDTYTIWLVEGTSVRISTSYFRPHGWSIRDGLADRNGDGKTDIVWVRFESAGGAPPVLYETEGALWTMDGTMFAEYPMPVNLAGRTTADFNGDGKSDILYRVGVSPCCDWTISLMHGPSPTETKTVCPRPSRSSHVVASGSVFPQHIVEDRFQRRWESRFAMGKVG